MKMGKLKALQSILNDRNKNLSDTKLLNDHIDLKIKPLEDVNIKDKQVWDLIYEIDFIISFLCESYHTYPELVDALRRKTFYEYKNVKDNQDNVILDLSQSAMYNAFGQPNDTLD